MTINTVSLFNGDYTKIAFEEGENTIKIKTPDHEEGFGIIIKNEDSANDATVTVKGSNSILSVGDMIIPVEKGEQTLINLKNTGRYKNVSGEVSGTENISVFAFEL